MELRHSLEHIIRAKANLYEVIAKHEDNPDYFSSSIDKAIGHEYRAFFDAADWFSISIRERIVKDITGFSPANISAVLEDYYPVWRPRIDEICQEIATIRESKDISKRVDLLDEVDTYRAALEELLEFHKKIQRAKPSLEEWRKNNSIDRLVGWLISGLIGAAIYAAILALTSS